MKILKLHIDHFGKFKDRTLTFSDGINIISGENESGKSTLHSFIGAMLLGLERSKGRAAKNDVFSRYRPWDGGTYGGSITLEHDGCVYTITRDFGPESPSVSVFDETNGKELEATDELIGKITLGLTPPLYRNTISVGQLSASTGGELAAELRNHIVNLRSSGSYSLDVENALKNLASKRRRISGVYDKDAEALSSELSEKAERLERSLAVSGDDGLKKFQEKMEAAKTERDFLEKNLEETTADISRICDKHRFSASLFAAVLWALLCAASAAAFVLAGLACLDIYRRGGAGAQLLPYGVGAIAAAAGTIVFLILFIISLRRRAAVRTLIGKSRSIEDELSALKTRLLFISDEKSARDKMDWERGMLEDDLTETASRLAALEPQLQSNREIREECAAIDLAAETIRDISANDFSGFGKYLGKLSSMLVSSVTGSYSGLYIGDDMSISLLKGEKRIPLASVSTGTLDQIYLAVRLACIGFFWEQEDIPLLLDDTFAMYDDSRLERTLCWLSDIYSGQVFVFSCHLREASILAGLGLEHTVITL